MITLENRNLLFGFLQPKSTPKILKKSTLISAQKYILPPHNPKRELKRKGRAGDRGDLYIDAGLTQKKNSLDLLWLSVTRKIKDKFEVLSEPLSSPMKRSKVKSTLTF